MSQTRKHFEVNPMSALKLALFVVGVGAALTATVDRAQAQVRVEVGIGAEPDCPYGYYDVAPYACAPYGYYGKEWFVGGIFIGAGPWFHGTDEFRGHVNNRFHPDHGYKGPAPKVGDKPEPNKRIESLRFKGNEVRDGRGHVVKGKR
jgi:hypothetical protein